MDQKKEKKISLFKKLYKQFVEECLEHDIAPMPMMVHGPRGTFPYMDFVEVSDEKEKKKMLDELT